MSELAARSNHRDGDALQVAVGDGVASREAEAIVADAITSLPQCGYAIVSEAGPALSALKECARALLAIASGWPQHCCAGTCCVIAATSSAFARCIPSFARRGLGVLGEPGSARRAWLDRRDAPRRRVDRAQVRHVSMHANFDDCQRYQNCVRMIQP